jgi:PEP-CTERM motif
MLLRSMRLPAAALLAGAVMLGASAPAKATFVVTITVTNQTTLVSTTVTHTFGGAPTAGFSDSTLAGTNTIAFTGLVQDIAFSVATTANSNGPGTPTLAALSISSNTVNNTSASAAELFKIVTSDNSFTAPSSPPPVTLRTSTSGTLTTGTLSSGTFDATADGITGPTLTFAASGTGSVAVNGTPVNGSIAGTPYTITDTYQATLAAGSTTASIGGTATVVPTPEPTTVASALAGLGLFGGGYWLRRRKVKV